MGCEEKMKNRILQSSFFGFLWLCLMFVTIPTPSAEQVFSDPSTGMEFVWVPGGSFRMGQTELEKEGLIKEMGQDRYEKYCADELPRHRVCVDGFWMGKYEVTNAQYRRFISDHDSKLYKGH